MNDLLNKIESGQLDLEIEFLEFFKTGNVNEKISILLTYVTEITINPDKVPTVDREKWLELQMCIIRVLLLLRDKHL